MEKIEVVFEGPVRDLVRWRRNRRGVHVLAGNDPAIVLQFLLDRPAALKDMVESVGVPHCEIGAVAGDLTDLGSLARDGCRVTVSAAQPFPLADPRFLCDNHLGRLARWLRLLGFDTLWDPVWPEAEVARRGINSGRTVLSRSLALLKRRELVRAMLVRPDDPLAQARQVVARFQLAGRVRMFGRCSVCNGLLEKVAKADVRAQIPPRTARWLDEYYRCRGCGRLYWEGTHTGAIETMLHNLTS